MALQKDTDFKGITCNYWKILGYMPNFLGANNCIVRFALYFNQAAREADLDNNIIKTIDLSFVAGEYTREELYNLAKQEPQFEGAVDV